MRGTTRRAWNVSLFATAPLVTAPRGTVRSLFVDAAHDGEALGCRLATAQREGHGAMLVSAGRSADDVDDHGATGHTRGRCFAWIHTSRPGGATRGSATRCSCSDWCWPSLAAVTCRSRPTLAATRRSVAATTACSATASSCVSRALPWLTTAAASRGSARASTAAKSSRGRAQAAMRTPTRTATAT